MSRLKITGVTVAWIVATTALATPAHATPVTFVFSGEINEIRDDDGILGDAVTIGSPFWGAYTFESTTPDRFPEVESNGSYRDAITTVSGFMGSVDFGLSSPQTSAISIRNDIPSQGGDGYGLIVDDVETPFFGQTSDVRMFLTDPTGAAFNSDSLPLMPPDLSLFSSARFSLQSASETIQVQGVVTSLIPEPATLILALLGGVLFVKRRRSWPRRTSNNRVSRASPGIGGSE